jgi:uncharacterized protein (DUF1697 family)
MKAAPRAFAFLRAINVGGHTVTMGRLKALFEGLGLRDVETFIASGNVVFEGTASAPLRTRIEARLCQELGFEVATFLRSEGELAALVQDCPYSEAEVSSARALNVIFLQAPLDAGAQARLQALTSEVDTFMAVGREVWWLCQAKQSESKFSNAAFERATKVPATIRSFNTVKRMVAKYLNP